MSASLALTALVAAATPIIGFLTGPTRSIGTLIPGVVMEETHEDRLTITDHPVERGANTTDHAFKEPARCTISCQWSNTQASVFDFSESYIIGIYKQLLDLQTSRSLIAVVTGKRAYNSMLIESISTNTTKDTAFSLPATISLREVILVQTSSTTLPPADQHTDPQQTAPPFNMGTNSVQGTGAGTPATQTSVLANAGTSVSGFAKVLGF
jgi:hypothetical protein